MSELADLLELPYTAGSRYDTVRFTLRLDSGELPGKSEHIARLWIVGTHVDIGSQDLPVDELSEIALSPGPASGQPLLAVQQ